MDSHFVEFVVLESPFAQVQIYWISGSCQHDLRTSGKLQRISRQADTVRIMIVVLDQIDEINPFTGLPIEPSGANVAAYLEIQHRMPVDDDSVLPITSPSYGYEYQLVT